MTTGKVGFQGKPPTVGVTNVEKDKYTKLWKKFPQYRKVSPGENIAEYYLHKVNPPKGSKIIDFGCGTGRGGLKLYQAGMDVVLTDFVPKCLDKKVRKAINKSNGSNSIRFVEHDLNSRSKELAIYGYCCDVLEHIPEAQIDIVIQNLTEATQNCFFMIHTQEDKCGELIGDTLHVNQQEYKYWAAKFAENDVTILWSEKLGHSVIFYVTAWSANEKYPWSEEINTTPKVVRENILANSKLRFKSIQPHEVDDTKEVMLLGGGPSLNDFKDEIIEQREAGMPMITTNGSYNWAIRNGIAPSAQLVIDSREFNKKFLRPLEDDTVDLSKCVYFIASSCHPALFEGMPEDRTYFWHVALSKETLPAIREGFGEELTPDGWWSCPGGSTVILRAICLLPFLGYVKQHIYGFDSCVSGDGSEHHAYAQPENERANLIPMVVDGVGDIPSRMFMCHPWMLSQAKEFTDMVPMLGQHLSLDIKGDGLISHIIKTGAQAPKTEV